MQDLKSKINLNNMPQHVAIIMDGNGRWAKKHGKSRVFGHRNGVKSVRQATEAAAELGVKYLTLYAFSTENWNRPKIEVNALMALLVETIKNEVESLKKNNIQLAAIGDLKQLPRTSQKTLQKAIADTSHNSKMTLVLALNYSAKWEIMNAVKSLASQVDEGKIKVDEIHENHFAAALATKGMPDPELLIRTSGEARISNFLLWQLAYTELYFTKTFWPDFSKDEFYKAIIDYQSRERRFGKISEQL